MAAWTLGAGRHSGAPCWLRITWSAPSIRHAPLPVTSANRRSTGQKERALSPPLRLPPCRHHCLDAPQQKQESICSHRVQLPCPAPLVGPIWPQRMQQPWAPTGWVEKQPSHKPGCRVGDHRVTMATSAVSYERFRERNSKALGCGATSLETSSHPWLLPGATLGLLPIVNSLPYAPPPYPSPFLSRPQG